MAPATGHWNGQQAHPDAGTSLGPLGVQGCPNSSQNQCPGVGAHSLPPQWCFLLGFPVMCCEDVFLSDPLLPQGQRVPLYLSKAPQQVRALPPPWPYPSLQACLAGNTSHSLSSGDGLPETAAAAPHYVCLGPPPPVTLPEPLHRLAQWAGADRSHWPTADEPGGTQAQLLPG